MRAHDPVRMFTSPGGRSQHLREQLGKSVATLCTENTIKDTASFRSSLDWHSEGRISVSMVPREKWSWDLRVQLMETNSVSDWRIYIYIYS